MIVPIRALALLLLLAASPVRAGAAAAGPSGDSVPPRADSASYHDLNIFSGGPVDAANAPALPLRDSLRLRALSGAAPLAEVPVLADGSVRLESLPPDAPVTLELLDGAGRVLLSAHARDTLPAAGPSRVLRCLGCHAGHSTLPVPPDDEAALWFDAAPSAEVTASSSAPGSAGPRAVVDRRTRGSAREVAWISGAPADQWLDLRWPRPLEIRELTLYGVRPSREGRATVRECEVVLRLGGNELSRRHLVLPIDPNGTRLGVGLTVADEVEIRFARTSGLLFGRRAAALAEIEALARVP